MATSVTIATFNAENLFTRYKFKGKKTNKKDSKNRWIYREYTPKELANTVKNGFLIDPKKFKTYLKSTRELTAQAIKAVKADIVVLQEVENLDTLKKFKYPMVIDGNDNRFIDVGLLSNFQID